MHPCNSLAGKEFSQHLYLTLSKLQLFKCLKEDAFSTGLVCLLFYITSKKASLTSLYQRHQITKVCVLREDDKPGLHLSVMLLNFQFFFPQMCELRAHDGDGLNLIPLASLK